MESKQLLLLAKVERTQMAPETSWDYSTRLLQIQIDELMLIYYTWE